MSAFVAKVLPSGRAIGSRRLGSDFPLSGVALSLRAKVKFLSAFVAKVLPSGRAIGSRRLFSVLPLSGVPLYFRTVVKIFFISPFGKCSALRACLWLPPSRFRLTVIRYKSVAYGF